MLKHWVGITWFLGWAVAVLSLINNWWNNRRNRVPEKIALQTKVGAEVIRLAAHYGGVGPYSEEDLRTVIRQAQMNEGRVMAMIWELEEKGHATKNVTQDGEVSWFIN
jgi:hypothetical protein